MRGNRKLRLQYRAIAAYFGLTMVIVGAFALTPLAVLVGWPAEARHAAAFLAPGMAAMAVGATLFAGLRPREAVLRTEEGAVLVVLTWTAACLLGAWPLMAAERMTFTQGVFESVSGWTTTGLSVMDVSRASKAALLWRSTMQLAGGAGFAILMMAMIIGPVGPGVSDAEGRGDLLVPHVRRSAKIVLSIYAGYAVLTVVGYLAAGMGLFDAVNHAFAAVSTGGFSTYPESIGHWDSPAIEAVTMAAMLLGQTSFVTAYLLVTGNFRAALRDSEVRYVLLALPVAAAALYALVCRGLYPGAGKAVRVALFEAFSALTTTGFSTVGYASWKAVGIFVLVLLMFVGGGTCSTAGGLKQYRAVLLARAVWWEIRRALLPARAVVENSVWHGLERSFVTDARLRQVALFFFLYAATFAAGTFVLAAFGYPLRLAMFEFASAQGTVGLSLGVTSPDAPQAVLWAEIAGMILGRLEFFVVLVGLAKLARDVRVLAKPVSSDA